MSYFTIILHIQRSGGSSLDKILQKQFNSTFLSRQLKRFTRGKDLTKQEYWRKIKMSERYYSSHICYGIHEFLPQPYKYVAFVRDPLQRIISLYKYSLQNKDSFYHNVAVGKTFEEFVLKSELHELDNGQTRVIAGGDYPNFFINRTPYGKCDEGLLQIALGNIEKDFLMVGVTELYYESIVLLSKLNNWELEEFANLNSSAGINLEISDALKDQIRKANWLDYKLFEICREKLLNNFKNNEKLANEVKEFKLKNELFNKKMSSTYTTIDKLKRGANAFLKKI
ncbi:MAG: sulfotransferase family 2 domain-containing protein [Cyclobacteriaceae bacterium]